MKSAHDAVKETLPTRRALLVRQLVTLDDLGGTATVAQLDAAVIASLGLTEAQLGLIQSGSRTEIAYRLAWCRTEGSKRGWFERGDSPKLWRITREGQQMAARYRTQ